MEESEALLILTHLVKPREIRPLIALRGSAKEALQHVPWQEKTSWEQDLALVNKLGVHLISYLDSRYPASFAQLTDAPALLYIKGVLPQEASLAIVGTRICSLYGKECAEKIAEEVASYGMPVISGLARGIDTAAHTGALKAGKTVAFIGSGLAHLYPRENVHLAEKIADHGGAVVSELPMGTPPAKHLFPRRNRLIAAFAQGALLIEAPEKSGAMLTLEMAKNFGKPCFALPGRIDLDSFRGNHALIKAQKAQLVENGQEMVSLLQPDKGKLSFHSRMAAPQLEGEEGQLLSFFRSEEVSFDELIDRTKLAPAKLSAQLMMLVLKGAIREFPGRQYKLCEKR
ncbi:MAG: DNA-processing protein DprA [Chlamydiales bacterium]